MLKQFGIKPCSVNLNKTVFSKIRITCSAESSEKHVKLLCDVKQVESNNFTIKIKQKIINDIDIGEETNPRKKKENQRDYKQSSAKWLHC